MPDADLEKVAKAAAASGYSDAGQVCISTQRILAHEKIHGDFLDAFKEQVEDISTGNPIEASTKMGPMIREHDAIRVNQWVEEAIDTGAELITGGEREGQIHAPTLLANVKSEMRISSDEVFGPVVGVTSVDNIDEIIDPEPENPNNCENCDSLLFQFSINTLGEEIIDEPKIASTLTIKKDDSTYYDGNIGIEILTLIHI